MTYIEAAIQFPVLAQNLLILGKTPVIPQEDTTDIETKDLRKKQKYIQRRKEGTWER